jgi:hypothetical protein
MNPLLKKALYRALVLTGIFYLIMEISDTGQGQLAIAILIGSAALFSVAQVTSNRKKKK